MADHTNHDAGAHDDAHEDHGGTKLYLTIFFALVVLTAISFVTPGLTEATPEVGWIVMIAVSCVKATLVIMFFMHLKWEANWKFVLTFPAMMMCVFLAIMLVPDVAWRMDHASRERRLFMADPAAATSHDAQEDDQTHTKEGD